MVYRSIHCVAAGFALLSVALALPLPLPMMPMLMLMLLRNRSLYVLYLRASCCVLTAQRA